MKLPKTIRRDYPLIMLFVLFLTTDGGFRYLSTIQSESDIFTTDNFGNLYTVKDSEIKKYNSEGELLFTYSNRNLGKITSLDVSDPLKILVYYRDFQKTERLNKQLSLQGDAIDLFSFNTIDPSLVCSSYENGFWIWDRGTIELIRINQQLGEDYRSKLTFMEDNGPDFCFMAEKDYQVAAVDSVNGIYFFDRFGNYIKQIPVSGINNFQLIGNDIIFRKDSCLKRINLITYDEIEIILPEKTFTNARIESKKLYIQHPDSINIYINTKQ